MLFFFFFQAEDGIRDRNVTGVQTCALPIFPFAVGATTILWPGPPSPPNVYAQIERHKPTLFYSVPTNYGQLLAHKREHGDFRSEEHTSELQSRFDLVCRLLLEKKKIRM